MESANPLRIYVIAGEASGDLHGKNLIAAMRRLHPSIELRGVGGDGMAGQGVELVRHIRETSFMGFTQVIANLGKIRKLFSDVKADVDSYKPAAVVLIDYPGFNLRIARFFKLRGIKVFYYISPQLWAWKKGRVKQVRELVDKMFVILPFEKTFYENEGVDVEYMGHPLLDELEGREFPSDELRGRLLKSGERLVALLPGSRRQEISRILPKMLSVRAEFPHTKFVVAAAPNQPASVYSDIIGDADVPVVAGQTYALLAACDAALVTSGTATLETALFGVPQTVCYAANAASIRVARMLIKVPFISLVNLIMGRETIRELIQGELTAKNLADELRLLLDSEQKKSQIAADYAELRKKLGDGGASELVAKKILELLG